MSENVSGCGTITKRAARRLLKSKIRHSIMANLARTEVSSWGTLAEIETGVSRSAQKDWEAALALWDVTQSRPILAIIVGEALREAVRDVHSSLADLLDRDYLTSAVRNFVKQFQMSSILA